MPVKVLVLEDEIELSSFLQSFLKEQGDFVKVYDSPEKAHQNKEHIWADVIILDLMLGEESGKEFLIKIRKENINTPTIVVSALSQIRNKIDLMNCGADDYLVKPFNQEELYARINAIRRRSKNKPKTIKERNANYGDFIINWDAQTITYKNKSSRLTKKELEVLQVLLRNNMQITSKEDLISEVWGGKIGYHSNVIESTIRRLRVKIPTNKANLIENIRGIGYQINLE